MDIFQPLRMRNKNTSRVPRFIFRSARALAALGLLIAPANLGCAGSPLKPLGEARLVITVPPDIALDGDRLTATLHKRTGTLELPETITVEFVVTGYSQGKEIFSYAENSKDGTRHTLEDGYLRAIVKVKRQGKLHKVYFMESRGHAESDILEKAAAGLRRRLERL